MLFLILAELVEVINAPKSGITTHSLRYNKSRMCLSNFIFSTNI